MEPQNRMRKKNTRDIYTSQINILIALQTQLHLVEAHDCVDEENNAPSKTSISLLTIFVCGVPPISGHITDITKITGVISHLMKVTTMPVPNKSPQLPVGMWHQVALCQRVSH